MSPRPKRIRKVSNPPIISGFKPYGVQSGGQEVETVFLLYEEYEALRLCDYEMHNHHQASIIMDVSRPTLTRIYAKARYKVAEAFVKGLQIIIEGGKVYFDSEWFSCSSCRCFFNNPEKQEDIKNCPLCKSTDIINCEKIPEDSTVVWQKCDDTCLCTNCGFEKPHQHGIPCRNEICPDCKIALVRKGTPHGKNN
ncbi:MAG: DUF134 domain-containing protein [Bacteroidales bacterium]|nr:MAG: DUF134 domain-containing protein [Bacteroidales bacterium]